METEYADGPRIGLVLAAIFLLVVVGGTVDLILDDPPTLLSPHVGFEVLLVLLSLAAAAYLARGWYTARSRLLAKVEESSRLRRERQEWDERTAELLRGLSSAIADQFGTWTLTPTEGKVALMLLKGLSHKRIARTTDTSERTVRQHSVAIYKKSGLSGRAELAGFFLEALLLPGERPSPGSA
jgi:DNA-binding NarL/FixJ family response regulator